MSKSLYDEAIIDAKQLRSLAEDTAKNRIIEAVMPKIRSLVNSRILGEQLEDEMVEDLTDWPGDLLDDSEIDEPDVIELEPTPADNPGAVINVTAQGDVNIEVETDEESEEADLVLTDTMAEALRHLINGDDTQTNSRILNKIKKLEERVSKLRVINESIIKSSLSKNQSTRLNLSFIHCVREALSLRSSIILNEQNTQAKLGRRLSAIIKEMKQMSNQRNIFDFLFESEDESKAVRELEEAELSLELEDEELDDLATAEDVEAVDSALADILGDVEVSFGDEEADADLDADLDAEEDEVLDLDVEDASDEEVLDIDEGMLRREIHGMRRSRRNRRLREQEEGRAAAADPSLAHGGENLGDVILDVNEDDLLNALADELGDTGVATPTVESRRRRPSRRPSRRGKVQESRQVKQYRNALSGMKRQLVEMNLFNAKLLYANKLMQNKNLTTKQQRAIVEALDNAKTLREAKLLYKSLSESLTRRSRGKKLNEGSLRTLGSSSRSTRSAQSQTTNGVVADRWAVLAGLHGND